MEKVLLKATRRESLGKGDCKRLRRQGKIPAVMYGEGKKGVNIQVESKDLWHALHTEAGENAIITMNISGEGKPLKKTVIVREVQLDPVNDRFLHVDFHEISLKEKLKVKVPVAAKGEPVGVKEDEGVLNQVIWELEVECLPTEIPEHIDVAVDEMRIGDTVHVGDITLPGGVTILGDPEQVVLSVNPPGKEEEEEAPEEEAAAEAEEPEVIKKGKKEEEEEAVEGEEEARGKKAPPEGEAQEQKSR